MSNPVLKSSNLGYMGLPTILFVVSTIPGEMEKAYPVTSVSKHGDWKMICLNIAHAFQEIFGMENLEYSILKECGFVAPVNC